MKILFSDWTLPYLLKDANFPVGGWAVELSSWIHGLESLGCEVEVLTWLGAQEYIGKQTSVKLREAYRLRGGIKFLRYFYHNIPAIAEATRKAAPDAVIQACSGIDTAIMAIAARYAGATYIHRIANDCDVDDRLSTITRPYERLAFRWGVKRSDAIVCQNSYQFGRIQALYPGRPATVIHNPFRPSESTEQFEKDQPQYVAWIANFGPAKNVPLLNVLATQNPHVAFRVAGALSGLANASTREAVEALERLPNVTMMGYLSRQQVPEFLGRARYLLSTSLFEGMSNTFLEALSVGTPIICPARVDPDGIVARHNLGFVAADDQELSRLVDRAVAIDQPAYQEQSNRSRNYVREANDPRRIARQLTDFLEAARLTRASRLEFPT